jgi:hypothetical protein
MAQFDDIDKAPEEEFHPPPRRRVPIVPVLVVIAIAGVGLYVWFRRPAPVVAPVAVPGASAPMAAMPLAEPVEPSDLPPVDETDPIVRKLVRGLSTHPELAAWLATDGLIRNFVVIVANVAEGHTPTQHLKVFAPKERFTVRERQDDIYSDSRSYGRYNGMVTALASVDAQGAARVYTRLKPRLDDAYRDLGYPGSSFDTALKKAIDRLLSTPVVEGDIALVPQGGVYGFADPKLESLTAAEKQLLRTGPGNTRVVQAKLREIVRALGLG